VTVGNAFTREGVIEIRERATRSDRKVDRAQVVPTIREIAGTLANSLKV
jgi:hypothetical protein